MLDELDYGEEIPGVLCPACGGGLVRTASGAFCDWCSALVSIVGEVVVFSDEDQDEEEHEDYDDWWCAE